ncbi:hypothetical protein FGO68_gene9276 [Halteria grandinella]|uniref:Uncharacterized protein n=1 Tax=Halteria grandinella TaxID=5974 RepID=A0A8J8NV33_HALGN|nr:hypothetical protein FGO68_gene9276 [Halteria grandinella]
MSTGETSSNKSEDNRPMEEAKEEIVKQVQKPSRFKGVKLDFSKVPCPPKKLEIKRRDIPACRLSLSSQESKSAWK